MVDGHDHEVVTLDGKLGRHRADGSVEPAYMPPEYREERRDEFPIRWQHRCRRCRCVFSEGDGLTPEIVRGSSPSSGVTIPHRFVGSLDNVVVPTEDVME